MCGKKELEMLLTKELETTWNPANRKNYEKYGYVYKWRGKFIVPVEHLPKNSHAKVDILCDYCLEEGVEKHIPQTWQVYNKSKEDSIIQKDCCKQHWYKKCSESNQENYGVDNQFQREDVKNKIIETCMDKYGVEHYSQTEESKEKHKETCLDRYGYDNASKVPEFIDKIKDTQFERYGNFYNSTNEGKEKYKQTCQERYYCDNTFKVLEFKEKAKQTCFEKYGFNHPQQNPEIKAKALKTLRENGKVNTSKQQIYLHNLYGGELNYQNDTTGVYLLDIAFPDIKVYCEYNGGGHAMQVKIGQITEGQFQRKEMNRYYYLKRNGWKQIQIISPKDYLPSDEILLEEYNSAIQWLSVDEKYHSHYNIEIGNYANDKKYGHLRFIKDEDIKKVE